MPDLDPGDIFMSSATQACIDQPLRIQRRVVRDNQQVLGFRHATDDNPIQLEKVVQTPTLGYAYMIS